MEINFFLARKRSIISITLAFLILAVLVTMLEPLRYSSASKLLVVQKDFQVTDSYSISRSNQFLSNLLSEVVYSDSFLDSVLASGFGVEKLNFPGDSQARKKEWKKVISAYAISDTGMIEIIAYHQNKLTARQISQAVNYVLQTKHEQYHGLGDKVDVRVIDGPMVSRWPAKPNILLNLAFGLVAGLALGMALVYLYPETNFQSYIFPGKKRKEKRQQRNNDFSSVGEIIQNRPEFKTKLNKPEIPVASPTFSAPAEKKTSLEERIEDHFRGDVNKMFD